MWLCSWPHSHSPQTASAPHAESTSMVCLIWEAGEGGEMAQGRELLLLCEHQSSDALNHLNASSRGSDTPLWPLANHKHVHTHTCSHINTHVKP